MNASPAALSSVGLNGKNAISACPPAGARQRGVGGHVDALDRDDDALLDELVGAVHRRLRRHVEVADVDLHRVAVDAAEALVHVAHALLEALADLRQRDRAAFRIVSPASANVKIGTAAPFRTLLGVRQPTPSPEDEAVLPARP